VVNSSVDFFARQFDQQIATGDYGLNPFEQWTLPFLTGSVVELGCGLGNLSLAAARKGLPVTALDACPDAVADLARRAEAESLKVAVRAVDLSTWRADGQWDSVVAIGLLMFFACDDARRLLTEIRSAVRPGGIAAINVLVEGTTFMGMFAPDAHCLLAPPEMREAFAGWEILLDRIDDFPAPGQTVKRFSTLIARRPGA